MTTSRTWQSGFPRQGLALLALVLGGLGTLTAHGATIREPATVFYGKVIGTGAGQPFLVTDGEMRWTIRRADGSSLPLKTRLWPQNNGEYSYRIDVPQEAMAMGLATSPDALPLKATQETHAVVEILVSGLPARIAGPGGASFEAAQVRRAATHRLDLEVPVVPPDTDGDGLPDWWEKQYGGDLAADGDADHDGRSNLAEYRAGSNPLQDSRRPSLATSEIRAYADATTGVLLRVLDSDSLPEDLTFTLIRPPAGAELRLRNATPTPGNPDAVLAAGATFTQRDVLAGRLVLVHSANNPILPSSFELAVRDGTPGIEAAAGSVNVTFYRPAPELAARFTGPLFTASPASAPTDFDPTTDENRLARNYVAGRDHGAVIRDAHAEADPLTLSTPTSALDSSSYARDYVPQFGSDRSQVLSGGRGNDVLRGGMADDVLSGGAGDNLLTGGGGRDRFVVLVNGAGTDSLTDFQMGDGDVLDLGACLRGASRNLRDYVRVVAGSGGTRLELNFNGDGSGFTDRAIELTGLTPEQTDLHTLVENGSLAVGSLVLPPRIAVTASRSDAAENGPRSGEFLVTRSGDLQPALSVRVAARGAAVNGVDFATVPSTISFAAGQREARITIEPFADSQIEPAETVELTVEAGEGYEIASTGPAFLSIADLKPVMKIEALEPVATTQPATPGAFLVSREVAVDRSVLVRLDIRGNAANGGDYQAVSRFINFAPGQATAMISIMPNASAGAGAAKSVLISLVTDPAYLVEGSGPAEVLLVPERTTLAGWRARFFPSSSGTPASFAAADSGGTGISHALRYALGLDALQPDRTRLPKPVVRDGHLTLDVWRRAGAEDVQFTVEVSSDLATWSSAPDKVERVFLPEHAGNPEVLSFRAVPAVKDGAQLFMNVRVLIRP